MCLWKVIFCGAYRYFQLVSPARPTYSGGFPSIRRNEVRELTASLLSEVCCDDGVASGVEPTLPFRS